MIFFRNSQSVAMRRLALFPLLLAALWLPGCTAITAVSAVPGALVNVAVNQFSGEEKCFPRNISPTLAAVQSSLRTMKLDIDVLEIRESGYALAFGNENLDGEITLEEMTPRLTTMNIRVRRTMRETSVEMAIIESIQNNLNRMSSRQRFRFAGYDNLRKKPDAKTERIGWYRKSAKLETYRKGKSDWFRLKLPSGKDAYLQGEVIEAKTLAKNGGKS